MARFTVFGNPIQHSLSPSIHALFAQQLGVSNLQYTRSLTSPAGFAAVVAEFFRNGGAGANVTLPFKLKAASLVTHQTERAQRAGSVNTLVPLGQGQLLGDNTDGYGLVADLKRQLARPLLDSLHVILLGAGGAARGVLGPLCAAGVEQITIVNRTMQTAVDLVHRNSDLPLRCADWTELSASLSPEYVVINATAASLQDSSLPIDVAVLANSRLCYDMMYSAQPTAFMQQASVAGASNCVDGLGMLVEQAALSFALWHDGQLPRTEPVIETIRTEFVNR